MCRDCCVGLARTARKQKSNERAADGVQHGKYRTVSSTVSAWALDRCLLVSALVRICFLALLLSLVPLFFQQNLWSAQCDICWWNRRFGVLPSVSPGRPTVTFSTTLCERARREEDESIEDEGTLARIYLDDQRSWIEYKQRIAG